MKPEQSVKDKVAIKATTRRALYDSSWNSVPVLNLHSNLALLTGILPVWAVHSIWRGLPFALLIPLILVIYVVMYPVYVHLDRSRTGITPTFARVAPTMAIVVGVALAALVVYYFHL